MRGGSVFLGTPHWFMQSHKLLIRVKWVGYFEFPRRARPRRQARLVSTAAALLISTRIILGALRCRHARLINDFDITVLAKTRAPWTTQRWKSTSTEMTTPGITNACSPPPRRAPHLSSGPHLSSTAPRQCAPRNCAPASVRAAQLRAAYIAQRKWRRAIAAAQFAPHQHTAPIISRPSSSN